MEDYMIVDAHSHLGDILNTGGGALIDRTGVSKKILFDPISITESGLHRTYGLGSVPYRLFKYWIVRAERARNAAATLENMGRSLDEAGIDLTVCLPIAPYVTFGDLAAARMKDKRILPFTSIDFNASQDPGKQLANDVKNGAFGLKLHPIIQSIPLTDRRVLQAVQAFEPYKKPVFTHAGVSSYYLGKEKSRNVPANGKIHYIEELVKTFPKVRFVIGHSGLFQSSKVMKNLRSCHNIWLDTSFQSPSKIRKLISIFGEDRIMFASDWPYGNRMPAINAVRVACRGDRRLEENILSNNACDLLGL